MTDNEIIKALECCLTYDCDNCHFNPFNCDPNLQEYAIGIINRQKAEIEELKEDNKQFANRLVASGDFIEKEKAEAIKEFAERLKKHFKSLEWQPKTDRKTLPIEVVKEQMRWVLGEVSIKTIENLVKEMVGERE